MISERFRLDVAARAVVEVCNSLGVIACLAIQGWFVLAVSGYIVVQEYASKPVVFMSD